MPKAATILTGQAQTRKNALSELSKFGEVDESTLISERLPGIYVEGDPSYVSATKYTAEVAR